MESPWQRRRILIWGKTRPEISKTYRETVCTGGVFEDTKRLVRLYPIPLRYLDDQQVFKKYQWIEADVMKSSSDARPESYKISATGIQAFGVIPTKPGDWSARAQWILNPENIYPSVEALQAKQQQDRTSLGLVQPAEVIGVHAERYSPQQRDSFWQRYRDALQQLELDLGDAVEVRPLSPPDYHFKVQFRCNDVRCNHVHDFSILDWELDALYFTCRQKGDAPDVAAEKVVNKLRTSFAPHKDLYFFLGNISNHQHLFTVVGLWYPKKVEARQTSMFDMPNDTLSDVK